jgi:hypothetical protein
VEIEALHVRHDASRVAARSEDAARRGQLRADRMGAICLAALKHRSDPRPEQPSCA